MASGIWEQIAGKWRQFKGEVQRRWGMLTEDDLEQIQGEREILAGRIQERYGIAKEEATRQVDEWAERLNIR